MTGREHYREAEKLAARAEHLIWGDGNNTEVGTALAGLAQVHATLALAAATRPDISRIEDADAELGRPRYKDAP